MGRPKSELIPIYLAESKKRPFIQRVSDGIYVSLISGLSLNDYIAARTEYCLHTHTPQPCTDCTKMLNVAKSILQGGYCTLKDAFQMISSEVKYTAERARRKLLQMPLVSIRVGKPNDGNSFTLLLEHIQHVDYRKMGMVMNVMAEKKQSPIKGLEKSSVRYLLNFAKSDRERECLRYAIVKVAGITPTEARRRFGFEGMVRRSAKVEETIAKAQEIREAIEELTATQDKALLLSHGIIPEESDTSSTDESCSDTDSTASGVNRPTTDCTAAPLHTEYLKTLLHESHYNWFEFSERVEREMPGASTWEDGSLISKIINTFELSEHDMKLTVQSKEAYDASELEMYDQECTAGALNGNIVSESEYEDVNDYVGLKGTFSDRTRTLVSEKRKSLQRCARRQRLKLIEQRRFLSRRKSKRVSKVIQECPDIGETVERFVHSSNVGADHSRYCQSARPISKESRPTLC